MCLIKAVVLNYANGNVSNSEQHEMANSMHTLSTASKRFGGRYMTPLWNRKGKKWAHKQRTKRIKITNNNKNRQSISSKTTAASIRMRGTKDKWTANSNSQCSNKVHFVFCGEVDSRKSEREKNEHIQVSYTTGIRWTSKNDWIGYNDVYTYRTMSVVVIKTACRCLFITKVYDLLGKKNNKL